MSFRKNVFILGAGFSKDAGAKTMDDFFPHARNLRDDPESPLTPEDKSIFSRVIEYRFGLNKALAKVQEDLDNIEKLFGFLEMEVQLSLDGNRKLLDDMKYLVGRTLEVDTFHALEDAGFHTLKNERFKENQYRYFVALVTGIWNAKKLQGNRAVDSIISFNYDLVLERELAELGILPDYQCGPNAIYSPKFDGERYQLKFLKLHGSLNWAICRKCNRLYHLRYKQYLVKNLSENVCEQCKEAIQSFLIVPPTWNKGTEQEFIRYVWSAALSELKQAGRIFIVGYSFPESDQFFKYMLGSALAHNDGLVEIIIVNPNVDAWKRFQSLFNPYFRERTVRHLGEGDSGRTASFIGQIPNLTNQPR
jgi:NAD-dependent SIR2 family protein deacetylase